MTLSDLLLSPLGSCFVLAHHDGRRAMKTSTGHTKPLTRKTFRVSIRTPDADRIAVEFWRVFGSHAGRTRPHDSKTVLNAAVHEGQVVLYVDYVVRGGFPSDITRWAGRLIWGEPDDGSAVDATLLATVVLPEPTVQ